MLLSMCIVHMRCISMYLIILFVMHQFFRINISLRPHTRENISSLLLIQDSLGPHNQAYWMVRPKHNYAFNILYVKCQTININIYTRRNWKIG